MKYVVMMESCEVDYAEVQILSCDSREEAGKIASICNSVLSKHGLHSEHAGPPLGMSWEDVFEACLKDLSPLVENVSFKPYEGTSFVVRSVREVTDLKLPEFPYKQRVLQEAADNLHNFGSNYSLAQWSRDDLNSLFAEISSSDDQEHWLQIRMAVLEELKRRLSWSSS